MKTLSNWLLYSYTAIILTSCGVISYSTISYSNQQDIDIAFCINGIWGAWQWSIEDKLYYDPSTKSLYIYNGQDHPSLFKVLIKCSNSSHYTQYRDKWKWTEYSNCTITYNSNIQQALQYSNGVGNEGRKMITKQCTVTVQNGRFEEIFSKGKTFNVFTNDCAFGIATHKN